MKKKESRKKILVLTSTFPRWADDTDPPFVYELCRRLSKNFLVHVLAPHTSGAQDQEQLNGIRVTRYRYFVSRWENLAYCGGILSNLRQKPMRYGLIPFFILAQVIAIVRLLRRCQYDCIHAHWMIPQGLTALIARLFVKSSTPLIVTSHGSDLFSLKGAIFNHLKRYVADRTTAVAVVSNSMATVMRELTIDESKVHVIPMGVDLHKRFIPPITRQATGSLLFVGRFVEQKGLIYLIEALPSILAKHPKTRLRIVGGGQEKDRIKKRIAELNLCNSIEFKGSIGNHELPDLYRTSDIVVFPSTIAEGFGLVLVEALGCECAAVVTDLPALKDIILDGTSALVVRQRDVAQLAQNIILLLDDTKLRQTIGKQGRAHVLQRFDWEIITNQYIDLFHSVIM